MHSFARHRHSSAGSAPAKETKGLIENTGHGFGDHMHMSIIEHGGQQL
jgi:hypothetical protein